MVLLGKNVDTNSASLHLERFVGLILLSSEVQVGLNLLKEVELAWCKNGFGEESDPLISKASCSPSAIQVCEKTLEGARLLNLWGRDWPKQRVHKSEALPLAPTVVQTATSSSPCGVPLL